MTPSVFPIGQIANGGLLIMPAPNADWLVRQVRTLRAQGVTKVLSLL
ncbi:hypothetical protein G3480_24385 [Thiorhodococcus mannitoliphagus]|uniref:Uncharacterized protein n=1 Tax=Thiorhodococcus mannitoliphagus TaxID=329406 RepID=A0A6P1E2F8_9GAMM|nr:hypothetical protein [Thiorhodococcus mannitoliphagus]NEX23393.1 hypothetical protein [Thiorhodococcus mannitoliphagus]